MHEKSTADSMFFPKFKKMAKISTFIILVVVISVIRQASEINHLGWKGKVKLSLLEDAIIIYVENSMETK